MKTLDLDVLAMIVAVADTGNISRLLTYARRMLALRDEAWAAVVRPDITGRVVIGVPDDYASSLFPPILKKFSATYPKVQIQVVGLPSVALAPMVKDGSVDLVCATRVKGLSGEFVRFEPMVWAATPSARDLWRERPLPIAVFLPGSVARENAIRSLEKAKIPYRTSYESILARSTKSKRPPCDFLAEKIMAELRR